MIRKRFGVSWTVIATPHPAAESEPKPCRAPPLSLLLPYLSSYLISLAHVCPSPHTRSQARRRLVRVAAARLRRLLQLGQLGRRRGPHRRARQPLQHRQAKQGLRQRRRVRADALRVQQATAALRAQDDGQASSVRLQQSWWQWPKGQEADQYDDDWHQHRRAAEIDRQPLSPRCS